MHIFISYAKNDTRKLALELRDIFNSLPTVTAWVDESGLKGGDDWAREIERQIKRCDLFVVLISKDVNREETDIQDPSYVLNEIHLAKFRYRKRILPVRVQDTEVPGEIILLQYIDLTQNHEEGIEKLTEQVCKRAGIETPRQQQEHERQEALARQKAIEEKQKRLKTEADKAAERERREQQEALVRQKAIDEKNKRKLEADKAAERKRREQQEAIDEENKQTLEAKKAEQEQNESIPHQTTLDENDTHQPPLSSSDVQTSQEKALEYTKQRLEHIQREDERRQKYLEQVRLNKPSPEMTSRPISTNNTRRFLIGCGLALVIVAIGLFSLLNILSENDNGGNEQRITLTPEIVTVPQDILLKAQNGVASNNEWTPYTATINGVEMVLVPAGCFMMGSSDVEVDYALQLYLESAGLAGQREWFEDEQPQHQQCFDAPFWMDKYEVTNAQFRQLNGQAGRDSAWTEDNRPREIITWLEARDFCESRGGRLPTEKEWEYAARGVDSLVFPWGNEFVAENVVFGYNSNNETVAVGSRSGGASWVGALDMSGNVWEWVSTVYNEQYPYSDSWESNIYINNVRGLRGGSWNSDTTGMRAADRNGGNPNSEDHRIGLRCIRSSF